jgi:acetylglutamate kinase
VTVRVVKIGGRTLTDSAWLRAFAAALAAAPGAWVVVHGGGPEITELAGRLGIEPAWSGGRRITTPEALDVTAMVLSGRVNKRVVAALLDAGVDALGVSGEDAGLLRARPFQDGALGRVGEVAEVRGELLRGLLSLGLTPVVSPVSRGADGALNVNADDAAAAIAVALDAPEIVFLTDVGVRDGAAELAQLTAPEARRLLAQGIATDGMAVKLEAALAVLAAGVPRVRIGPLPALGGAEFGTVVSGLEVAA